MGPSQELPRLLARLSLRGVTRGQAARALHLSVSALNKKLRGAAPLRPEEWQRLAQLAGYTQEDVRP